MSIIAGAPEGFSGWGDFIKHIEAVQPNFCRVLVRYNPQGDQKAYDLELSPGLMVKAIQEVQDAAWSPTSGK